MQKYYTSQADTLARQRSSLVLVQRVIDGDTISIASIGRVHLLGVSAMKLGSRPATAPALAREAQQRLASLVANRWVRIEYESEVVPVTSREAVYVFLEDGRFVNAWLVSEGLDRLSQLAAAQSHGDPRQLINMVLASMLGEDQRADDIALLCVRVKR